MRFQVRKRNSQWEVWRIRQGDRAWELRRTFPTWWQAMLDVTGDLPYGAETGWTPALRPVWVG